MKENKILGTFVDKAMNENVNLPISGEVNQTAPATTGGYTGTFTTTYPSSTYPSGFTGTQTSMWQCHNCKQYFPMGTYHQCNFYNPPGTYPPYTPPAYPQPQPGTSTGVPGPSLTQIQTQISQLFLMMQQLEKSLKKIQEILDEEL